MVAAKEMRTDSGKFDFKTKELFLILEIFSWVIGSDFRLSTQKVIKQDFY